MHCDILKLGMSSFRDLVIDQKREWQTLLERSYVKCDVALPSGVENLARVVYDSEAFQFIGSELYRHGGISLNEFYADYAQNYARFFNEGDEHAYQQRAKSLNLREAGDQAGFCLVIK